MTDSKDRNRADRETNKVEKHEPPHTTQKGVTTPKFGSAGSGGAEFEPIPEQHEGEERSKIHES